MSDSIRVQKTCLTHGRQYDADKMCPSCVVADVCRMPHAAESSKSTCRMCDKALPPGGQLCMACVNEMSNCDDCLNSCCSVHVARSSVKKEIDVPGQTAFEKEGRPRCDRCSESRSQIELRRGLCDDCWDREQAEVARSFVKHDSGKPRPELLPPRALEEVAFVLAAGAAKYGPDNWHKCEDTSRYIGAALRHVLAYQKGEKIDEETQRAHLAPAVASLCFVLELELKKGN